MKQFRLALILALCCATAIAQTTMPANVLVNKQTGTTYTVKMADKARLITQTNGSASTYTLPLFASGWFAWFQNRGTGTMTVDPAGAVTIDGAATVALTTGQGVLISSDGTNYFSERGVGSGGGTWGSITGTLSDQTDLQTALNAKQSTLTNSAGLRGSLSDENGSGVALFDSATSPTFITPTIASFVNANHNHTNSAGGGALGESALALIDVDTNNSSTLNHGFLSKLSNSATQFMNGQGNWATPAGGATNGATNGQVPISDGTNFTGDADLTFSGDTLSATRVASGQGTITNPAFCVGPCANQTGMWGVGAGFISFSAGGSHRLSMNDTFFEFPANQIVAWVSGVAPFGTVEDTTISRKSAGIVRFGTTTGNSAGSIEFTALTATGATQTLSNAAFTTCTALTTSSNVLTCTVSDRNLKQGFHRFSKGLSFVRNVKPQLYSFKEGTPWYDGGRERLGLVAQEVQQYLPNAVFPIGPNQPLQVDYNAVTTAALQVLQSVEARVTALERSQRALKVENRRLRRIFRRRR